MSKSFKVDCEDSSDCSEEYDSDEFFQEPQLKIDSSNPENTGSLKI